MLITRNDIILHINWLVCATIMAAGRWYTRIFILKNWQEGCLNSECMNRERKENYKGSVTNQ